MLSRLSTRLYNFASVFRPRGQASTRVSTRHARVRAPRPEARPYLRNVVLSFALALTVRLIAAGHPEGRPDEYQVKAAFLYNFAKFVEWPQEVFAGTNDPFVICVLGEDPFGRTLDDVLVGKKVEGRAFAVRRISDARRATGCQILFVSSSEQKPVLSFIASMKPAGILTVGESDSPTCEGMIVNLVLDDGKVRFSINTNLADREKLSFSSKLLSLAKVLKK
jgi:hypothetical protein